MGKRRKYGAELIPVEKRKRVIKVDKRRGRRGSGRGMETAGYVLSTLVFLLVLTAGAVFILLQSRASKIQDIADNAVPELRRSEDGTYELSWRSLEAADADYYHVEVSTYVLGGGSSDKIYFSEDVYGTSCQLPELPADEAFALKIDLIKDDSTEEKEHTKEQATLERYFLIKNPVIRSLDWEVDPDEGTALISFDYQGGNSCSIFVTEQGEKKLLKTVEGNSVELDLNKEKSLWVPTADNPCTLTIVPGDIVNGIAIYGMDSREIALTWEDFAARDIQLSMDLVDGCVCHLNWDALNCDTYAVQMRNNDIGSWETVKTVTRDEELTYTSPRLTPGAGYSFRVAAIVGDSMAVSEVQQCEVAVTPLYCTVWPVKDLKAYSDAARSQMVGEVKALDAHCVVAEQDGMFGVNIDGTVCYIESNYCMINLPEYVGGLCNYDITNSYESIFMAHGFEIPNLTGEVIDGFERVRLYDNSFLVPLLYPTAQKLETAIEAARERGYRLKIYEAFRPHEASVYMYQTALRVQDATLPENTYWGGESSSVLYVRETNENGETVERRKTYRELMCSNSFSLGAFVSAGVSRHNIGVAMDLTLETLDTGTELVMQTDIHDLSHFSALEQNNDEAKELAAIMKSAGYNDLYSEWWHFQDDEIKNKLSLPCINDGVSPECWMTNGLGWRYRDESGVFAADCTLNIDGREYTFDSEGYVQN